MKIALKTFVLAGGLLLTASAFGYFFWYKPLLHKSSKNKVVTIAANKITAKNETMLRLNKKVLLARDYIKVHHFDSRHCFLLDMRLPPGENVFLFIICKKIL